MSLHPLHKHNEPLLEYALAFSDLRYRGTGRTTAIALETIARAIKNPETRIDIVDHHDSAFARRELAYKIADICEKLGLKHLVIRDSTRPYIIFTSKEQ